MKDSESGEHLAPENFIDLVEGGPVEASHRLHVERCEACQGELEELRRTLTLLSSARELDAHELGVARPRARSKGLGLWLVAAAAILVAFVVSYPLVRPGGFLQEPDATASADEGLLPPVERDEAFQMLLVLTEELDGSEMLVGRAEEADMVLGEIDELTPEERGVLLERLAEEMRSIS